MLIANEKNDSEWAQFIYTNLAVTIESIIGVLYIRKYYYRVWKNLKLLPIKIF